MYILTFAFLFLIILVQKGLYAMTKEEFETLINSVKGKINETDSALISEDLLGIVSSYSTLIDELAEEKAKNEQLESDKEELLKVNGKLFQKVGFEKEEEKEDIVEDDEEEIKIEDIIDEKGDMI